MAISDFAFGLSAMSQLLLLIALLNRRSYRVFPILTCYMVYLIVTDPALYALSRLVSETQYERLYVLSSFPDYVFQAGIILEVIGAVAKPLNPRLPRLMRAIVCSMMLVVIPVAIAITSGRDYSDYDAIGKIFLRWDIGFAASRVVASTIAVMVIGIVGMGWRRLAARVAVGLSVYAVVSLIVGVARELGGLLNEHSVYAGWEPLRAIAWAGALIYVSCYILTKEQISPPDNADRLSEFIRSINRRVQAIRVTVARSGGL